MRFLLAFLLPALSFAASGDYTSTPDLTLASTHISKEVARAVFDLRGAVAGQRLISTPDTAIPAGATVFHTWLQESSGVFSTSSNTIAVGCVSSGDMVAAVQLANGGSSGTQAQGVQDNTFANRKRLTTSCVPFLNVGGGVSGISSGRLTVLFEYVPLD